MDLHERNHPFFKCQICDCNLSPFPIFYANSYFPLELPDFVHNNSHPPYKAYHMRTLTFWKKTAFPWSVGGGGSRPPYPPVLAYTPPAPSPGTPGCYATSPTCRLSPPTHAESSVESPEDTRSMRETKTNKHVNVRLKRVVHDFSNMSSLSSNSRWVFCRVTWQGKTQGAWERPKQINMSM